MREAATYRGARRNEYRADAQRVNRGWRMHSDMRIPPITDWHPPKGPATAKPQGTPKRIRMKGRADRRLQAEVTYRAGLAKVRENGLPLKYASAHARRRAFGTFLGIAA